MMNATTAREASSGYQRVLRDRQLDIFDVAIRKTVAVGKTEALLCFPDPVLADTLAELDGLGYKIDVSKDPEDGTMIYTVKW